MGVKVNMNVAQLEAMIRQEGQKALANGARSLRRLAEFTARTAVDNAPVDDGDLENAIKINEFVDEAYRKGFVVYVDPDAPVSGNDEDKTVGDYAMIMERQLKPYGRGKFNLGPKSRTKRAGKKDVGGRYMSRALKKAEERARKFIADDIKAGRTRRGPSVPGASPMRSPTSGDDE